MAWHPRLFRWRGFVSTLVFGLVMAGSAYAQQATPPAPQAVELTVPVSPVVIDGEVLFTVRGISSFPADVRAADIEAKIRQLAGDTAAGTPTLTLEDRPQGTLILANGQRLLVVLDEDAAIESVDRRVLAEAIRSKIASAIVAYRDARQPGVLWRHALQAVGATIAILLVAYTSRRLVRWLDARLARRYHARVQDVSNRALRIVTAEQVWRALAGILSIAWGLTVVALIIAYLRYVLGLFPWTRGAANGLIAMVSDPVRRMALGVAGAIPNFVFLAILFVVFRFVLKALRLFFHSVEAGTTKLSGFEREWAAPTYKLVRVIAVAFAVVVAYPYLPGSNTEAFKGVSIFMGVVISLGSSSIIGNLISGFSMTYRRTFRIGDMVQIGERLGEVQAMRLLVTHLRTPKNEEVIIPNSEILSTDVVNYTTMAIERGLILHTTVGIRYDVPWRQVEAILHEAARQTPGLRSEPAPFVLLRSLGDFSVTYELNVYCDTPGRMAHLYGVLHRNILDAFNEYGIQIMTPAYEGDPAEPKVVPKERWFTEPAQPNPPSPGAPPAKS